jgi:hypothetical protein
MTDALTRLGRFEDALITSIGAHHRRSRRRRLALVAAGLSVLLAGSALAATQLAGGDVSAARDSSLPQPPIEIMDEFRSLGTGSTPGALLPAGVPVDGRDLGNGIYVETRPNNILCVYVVEGAGQCRDADLGGQDVWLMSDIERESSETSPFDMHTYGLAKDGVAEIDLTTPHGIVSIPVNHNAFRATLPDTIFSDISAIRILHSDGTISTIDPTTVWPHASGSAVHAQSSSGPADSARTDALASLDP